MLGTQRRDPAHQATWEDFAGHGRLWPIHLWPIQFWPIQFWIWCACVCVVMVGSKGRAETMVYCWPFAILRPLKFLGDQCWSGTPWRSGSEWSDSASERRESTKLPKKWQCIWHLWATNWRGIHIRSEMNKLADELSRVAESGVTPEAWAVQGRLHWPREALRLGLF